MIYRLIFFIILNFLGLAVGGKFTGDGVPSEWYQNLNKAPWTPPGWVFGAAWTTIMFCFSFYLSFLWEKIDNRKLFVTLYVLSLVLNVMWNPVFFFWHKIGLGLVLISALTILTAFFFFHYRTLLGLKSVLILPYLIWLIIAVSLNAYVLANN